MDELMIWKEQDMEEKLLNRLAREAGIGFLSDLHNLEYVERISGILNNISSGEYTLEEWEEAAEYVLGHKPQSFDTEEAAYLFLKQGLVAASRVGTG